MMKEIVAYEKSGDKKILKEFEIDHYIELQKKKEEMIDILRDKYIDDSFAWCFDLLNSCNKNYETILEIFEEVAKKYKYWMEDIKMVGMIEKCLGTEVEMPVNIEDILRWNLFVEPRNKTDTNKNVVGRLNKAGAKEKLEDVLSAFKEMLRKVDIDENDKAKIHLAFMEDMKYVKQIYNKRENERLVSVKQKCCEKGYSQNISEEDIGKYEWILAMKKINK